MQTLTPCRAETPENIETKIGENDYVVGPFNPANFRRNRSKVVRSPYHRLGVAKIHCVSYGSKYRKSGNFDHPWEHNPKPIDTKLGGSNYVGDLTLTSKYGSNRST